jgi:hypothetical protein
MELEIPIPAQSGNPNAPDLSYVRRAWWDAINDVYLSSQGDGCPLRIAVEMRLMHGSNLILAPQNENKWTAAIGVVSIPEVGDAPWARFLQNLTDKWTSLGGNVRPHLAKQWQELAFDGKSARDYVRDVAFKTQFEKFQILATTIGALQGWTLADLHSRFSNELWDCLIFNMTKA